MCPILTNINVSLAKKKQSHVFAKHRIYYLMGSRELYFEVFKDTRSVKDSNVHFDTTDRMTTIFNMTENITTYYER